MPVIAVVRVPVSRLVADSAAALIRATASGSGRSVRTATSQTSRPSDRLSTPPAFTAAAPAYLAARGTPHTQAILPLLEQYKVPLIAPSTGAMVLHKPVNPWVFNVRATYQREAERAVQHLSLIGIERIGVIHVEDSFGADLLEGAKKGFAAVAKNPVFVEKYDRAKWDFSKIAPLVASDEAFFATNARLLRNPSAVNFLDGCALSLPCQASGEMPVGLMVWSAALRDDVDFWFTPASLELIMGKSTPIGEWKR